MDLRSFRSQDDRPKGMDVEKAKELRKKIVRDDIIKKLEKKYSWPQDQPKPEKVIEQAESEDFDIDEMIEKMDDVNGTGWYRWKWCKNYANSYGY